MLSRKERLPRGVALSRPPIFKNELYAMRCAPNKLLFNRFRVIVSLAVSKKATERHRIKRIVSDAARAWAPMGLDVVIAVFPSAAKVTKKELRTTLARAEAIVCKPLTSNL